MMLNQAYLKATIPINLLLNILPFLSVGHILIDHRHQVHIPNLLPHGTLIYYVTYLIYSIFLIYILFYFVSGTKIMVSGSALQIMIVLPLLRQELRLKQDATFGKRQYPLVSEFLERPENIVHMYRSLQILVTDMCYTFGLAIPPIQAVLGQMVISTAYLLISGSREGASSQTRFTSVILCGTIPASIVSWTIMLTCAGMMHKSATDCIASWKTGWAHWGGVRDRRYMGKFRKSCKPIYIGYPGFMIISRKSVVKFIQGVVRGTFRALLMLNEK